MERFHFAYAREFVDGMPDFKPRSPAIPVINQAFARNILRIRSLGSLPIILVGASGSFQAFDTEAREGLGVKNGDPAFMLGDPGFDLERWSQKESLRLKKQREWFDMVGKGERISGMQIGEINLGFMAPHGGDEMQEGIDSILGGMVIGAWTAFETMASDLWVASLNHHPVKLASLSGSWYKPKKSDDATWDQEKIVKLQDLEMSGYDLSKKMGKIHKHRFKWGVLEGIRSAYGAAFSNYFDDIRSAIADPSLDALAAARNVLVHKAGVIDGEFIRKNQNWRAFTGFSPESNLQLDGLMVRDLLSASLGSAIKLMNAVDVWLISH